MFYAYVLKSKIDGRLYKGMTGNLEKRLAQHNSGENKSTKGFMPWLLYHYESFSETINILYFNNTLMN